VSDGLPKSGQRTPEDSGVAVYFDLDGKSQCIPIDSFTKIEQNLAAVAATISALRSLERYGSGLMEAAFDGFTALPPAGSVMAGGEPWYSVLDVDPDDMHEIIKRAYQYGRSEHHPDRGGDAAKFDQVQQAWNQYQEQRSH